MRTRIGPVALGAVLALAGHALARQGVKQTERLQVGAIKTR